MTDFQSTFESTLDLTKPIEFPADMSHSIDPSNLIYQPSGAQWLIKDPFEVPSWDSVGVGADQTFDPSAESAGLAEVEPRSSYATSDRGAPARWEGYKIKTVDTLSDACSLSNPESEMWSLSQSNDKKNGSNHKSARSTLAQDTDAAAVVKQKRASHNAIEKRYRINMNAKFLALGNAIPCSGGFMRTQLASNRGPRKHSAPQPSSGRQEEQQQQNKSEILTNTLSYIHELENENLRLKSELRVLKENLLPRGNMRW